jgi:5-methylcytosine-specific restriction protein A
MPNRPPIFRAPGTRTEAERKREFDQRRATARQRGYTDAWDRAAKLYLFEHPLCVLCARQGRHTAATQVDHIKPHRGNTALFSDPENWQSLCASCHSRKTATEDGGFGRSTPPGRSAK